MKRFINKTLLDGFKRGTEVEILECSLNKDFSSGVEVKIRLLNDKIITIDAGYLSKVI
jgi:hypothetical protein